LAATVFRSGREVLEERRLFTLLKFIAGRQHLHGLSRKFLPAGPERTHQAGIAAEGRPILQAAAHLMAGSAALRRRDMEFGLIGVSSFFHHQGGRKNDPTPITPLLQAWRQVGRARLVQEPGPSG
jgi:hypothetical protein